MRNLTREALEEALQTKSKDHADQRNFYKVER
jgi:hypothetical protein